MNFDVGEVLSRSWQITWKHKVLWIIGIVFGAFIALMLALAFLPAFSPILAENARPELTPVIIVGFFAAFLLFMLVLYPVSVLAQTSLTLGILDAELDHGGLSVRELIQRSLPFFWRVLALLLLYQIGVMLFIFIIEVITVLLAIVTFGLGIICIMPLMFLTYPVLYGAILWMEQSMNGIIIDKLTVGEAARQGWNLIRNNLLPVALMAVVLYFGIGLITGVFMVPLMAPFFFLPFSFMEHEINWTVLSIALLFVAIFIPLFAIVLGWSMIFSKSAWVLTYLRLTRSPKPQLSLQEAAS